MKAVFFTFSLFFIFSCSQYENINTEVPTCIQEIIDDSLSYIPLKTVRVQKEDGELHYWLNTDARHWDGGEEIISSSCEIICIFCGECTGSCESDYKEDEWIIIWSE